MFIRNVEPETVFTRLLALISIPHSRTGRWFGNKFLIKLRAASPFSAISSWKVVNKLGNRKVSLPKIAKAFSAVAIAATLLTLLFTYGMEF